MNIVKNIKSIAIEVLINEADAIKKLIENIDEGFEGAVEAILSTSGRVVITGIGKSAIIAQKIVSTLNSTGTPALFMHAADAIHGDLGMIQKEDVVICISKSGNSPEIKVLVPLLKRRGSQLIALVSDTGSYLARQSDYVLDATIEREACPLNLAPTTSSTVHLAIGDALAVCLLEARGFTKDDYAVYHPGGALGKRLYLKVDDIYPNNECPSVSEHASVKDIIMEISSKRLGATAVVNEKNDLVGIVTDGDVRRMLEKYTDLKSINAKDVMTVNPKVVEKGEYAAKVLNMMQQNNITQVAVVDGKKLVGFVHLHDLLKEGII